MCLAIYRPVEPGMPAPVIPNAYLDAGMERHPDGFGVAFVQNGKVVVEKFAPHERKQFRKAFRRVEGTGQPFVAHLRFATSGPKTADMAHPYVYTDSGEGEVAVIHNGIISIKHDPKVESDTRAFVRLVLAELPSRWWTSSAMRFLVAQSIGYSKLAIVTPRDGVVLINERDGMWDASGVWYSSTYKPQSYKAPAYTGKAPVGLIGQSGNGWAVIPATTPESAHVKDTGQTRSAVEPAMRHNGHLLDRLKRIGTKDCHVKRAVRCVECGTFGDIYVIEGTRFIELAHKADSTASDEGLFGAAVTA
jgi:Glutamine amidotransferases class-II